MTHYFLEPVLALCSDRSILAMDNPRMPRPDVWFSDNYIAQFGLTGISFDFFINWISGGLDREVWLKRPINPAAIHDWGLLQDQDIIRALRNDNKFRRLVNFAGKNFCTASAIIFDDLQDWSHESAGLIYAHWPKDASSGQGLRIRRITRAEIEETIRAKSGGAITIGNKGLFYGTSRLECAMSKTNALWPGDADLVLCDNQSLEPIAILEFKKHTQNSKLYFANQCLSNYYPRPDGRKYDRLALLSHQLVPGKQIPVFALYYSTDPTELSVLVEQVKGMAGSLQGAEITRIAIDPTKLAQGLGALVSFILSRAHQNTGGAPLAPLSN